MSAPAQVTEAHIAKVRAYGYTTDKGVQMAAQFVANNEAAKAERDQLRAELEKVYALVTPDGCDLAPRGLFETARAVTELRAEMERLKAQVALDDKAKATMLKVFHNEQARAERAELRVKQLEETK